MSFWERIDLRLTNLFIILPLIKRYFTSCSGNIETTRCGITLCQTICNRAGWLLMSWNNARQSHFRCDIRIYAVALRFFIGVPPF
jgi:hypothetical protein